MNRRQFVQAVVATSVAATMGLTIGAGVTSDARMPMPTPAPRISSPTGDLIVCYENQSRYLRMQKLREVIGDANYYIAMEPGKLCMFWESPEAVKNRTDRIEAKMALLRQRGRHE